VAFDSRVDGSAAATVGVGAVTAGCAGTVAVKTGT